MPFSPFLARSAAGDVHELQQNGLQVPHDNHILSVQFRRVTAFWGATESNRKQKISSLFDCKIAVSVRRRLHHNSCHRTLPVLPVFPGRHRFCCDQLLAGRGRHRKALVWYMGLEPILSDF